MKFKIILLLLFGGSLIAAQHDRDCLITLPSKEIIQAAVLKAIPESKKIFAEVVAERLAGTYKNSEDIAEVLYAVLHETDPDFVRAAQDELSPLKLIPAAQRLLKKL